MRDDRRTMSCVALDDDTLAVELARIRGLVYLVDMTVHDRLDGHDLNPTDRRAVVAALLSLAEAMSDRLDRITALIRAGKPVEVGELSPHAPAEAAALIDPEAQP